MRAGKRRVVVLCILLALAAGFAAAGAQGAPTASVVSCDCHADKQTEIAASSHAILGCTICHPGAELHSSNPASATLRPLVPFAMEQCGQCHEEQYATNTYDDEAATRFAGSPVGASKTDLFEHYNDIIDGHPFTIEYNEDRTHGLALEEHIKTKRGKAEVCLQCKSTKVAYYWDNGERTIHETHTIVGGDSATEYVIPAGTKIDMKTNWTGAYPNTYEVQTVVTLPDSTKYSSYTLPGATKNLKWTWAAALALNNDQLDPDSPTRDSGTACNHCHDPHNVARNGSEQLVGWRIVRKAELKAIAEGGLNPYDPASPTTFDGSLALDDVDRENAICAQCHVEYVCGGSRIDGIDRDFFPWAKASDLHDVAAATFPGYGDGLGYTYVQDWLHGAGPLSSLFPANGIRYVSPHAMSATDTPVPLIKSQHPEAEANWNSDHYQLGAGCAQCHMPQVEKGGVTFTSHFFASPYKYYDPSVVASLAAATGISVPTEGVIDPCSGCHDDVDAQIAEAEALQDDFYDAALAVESLLINAMSAIEEATSLKGMGGEVDTATLDAAIESYQRAHAVWENLAVSENSMGAHDPEGEGADMAAAGANARDAFTLARRAVLEMRTSGMDAPVVRQAGATRYETALALSAEAFTDASCNNLVLASGADYPDALSASGLAGAFGSPVLLTQPTWVPDAVLGEIDRLSATDDSRTTVWIVGGTGAVGPAVDATLRSAGYTVERLAGATRYETAAEVARATVEHLGMPYEGTVFLASGLNFADALACSPIAWANGIPVLLTPPGTFSTAAGQAMQDIDSDSLIVLGGTGAISAATMSAADAVPGIDSAERWAGSNRFGTAVDIADKAIGRGWASSSYVGISSAWAFADALAGGPVAGAYNGVLLMTYPAALAAETQAWLDTHQIERVDIYGGSGAVSDGTRAAIDAVVNP